MAKYQIIRQISREVKPRMKERMRNWRAGEGLGVQGNCKKANRMLPGEDVFGCVFYWVTLKPCDE